MKTSQPMKDPTAALHQLNVAILATEVQTLASITSITMVLQNFALMPVRI